MKKHITLTGMPGIGVGHWANLLQQRGYDKVNCQTSAETRFRLSASLEARQWQRMSARRQNGKNHDEFVAYTHDAMNAALLHLETMSQYMKKPLVIAAPHDIIDMVRDNPDLGEQMRQLTHVVHLEPSAEFIAAQAKNNAQAIHQENLATQRFGEGLKKIYEACHVDLLHRRLDDYRDLAHTLVPYRLHHHPQAGTGILTANILAA